jgi:hypothetical protein
VKRAGDAVARGAFGGSAVISLEDCLALCGLTEQEVLALAEHEHVPEIAAAALGHYLINQPKGCQTIRDMLAEDIAGHVSVATSGMLWNRQRHCSISSTRIASSHISASSGLPGTTEISEGRPCTEAFKFQ